MVSFWAKPSAAVWPVLGDDHAVHRNAHLGDVVDEAQHLHVIADAKVCPHLCLFDVVRRDGEDDFGLLAHFVQKVYFSICIVARQHPCGVIIVKKLAAELKVQLAAPLRNALCDVLCLLLDEQRVIEPLSYHNVPAPTGVSCVLHAQRGPPRCGATPLLHVFSYIL